MEVFPSYRSYKGLFSQSRGRPVCGHAAVFPVLSEAGSGLRGLLFWKGCLPEPWNRVPRSLWASARNLLPTSILWKPPPLPGVPVDFFAPWLPGHSSLGFVAILWSPSWILFIFVISSSYRPRVPKVLSWSWGPSFPATLIPGWAHQVSWWQTPPCAKESHMLNFGFALNSRFLQLTVNSTFPTGVSNRCFMITGVKAELFFWKTILILL